jgi:Na+:H+ antiporter, NhaA family
MKTHSMPHHAMTMPLGHRYAHVRRRHSVARVARVLTDRFLLLPIGALIALAWSNTAAESYFRFAHALAFPVNEIAMAFFLALIAQEVREALMPGGALHTWRRWGLAMVAAAGGVAGAIATYLLYVNVLHHEAVLLQGWPIAAAIDAAAGYYVLKAIVHRSSALPFLLLVALVTDAAGLLFILFQPPRIDVRSGAVMLMLGALGAAAVMRRRRVRSFGPYIAISGTLSWLAFYWEGIHPALALIPVVPFLPREPRRLDIFADPRDDDAIHHFEHEWNEAVQVILLFFGLVNAGVPLHWHGTGTWAMLTAALVGRPLGVMAAVWIAVAAGLHLPRSLGWRELLVTALATSSGFTFALFFATGVMPMGPILDEIKLGAFSTILGAVAAIGLARVLRVGRFGRRTHG